jgi:hypothetical protein
VAVADAELVVLVAVIELLVVGAEVVVGVL